MNRAGLTLTEVLVSIIFIAITFAVLGSSQIGNMKVTRDSAETTAATLLMLDKYEEIKAQILYVNRGDPSTSNDDVYNFDAYYNCPTVHTTNPKDCSYSGTIEGGYSYSVTVTGFGSSTDPRDEGMVQVDVSVSGPTSVSMTAIASCYDVYPAPKITAPRPCPSVGGSP